VVARLIAQHAPLPSQLIGVNYVLTEVMQVFSCDHYLGGK